MIRRLGAFLTGEQGVVTVDWIVLTAFAAVFGIVVMLTLGTGTQDVGASMETALSSVEVSDIGTIGVSQ